MGVSNQGMLKCVPREVRRVLLLFDGVIYLR